MQMVDSAYQRQVITVFQLRISPRHDELAGASDRQDKYVTRKKTTNNTLISRMSSVRPCEINATTTVIRSIVAKSAISAAINIVWPKRPRISPCSLRTGMTTPSDVVDMMSAITHGLRTSPIRKSTKPTAVERARVSKKLSQADGERPEAASTAGSS